MWVLAIVRNAYYVFGDGNLGKLADFAQACYSSLTPGDENLVSLGGLPRPPRATMKCLYKVLQAAYPNTDMVHTDQR